MSSDFGADIFDGDAAKPAAGAADQSIDKGEAAPESESTKASEELPASVAKEDAGKADSDGEPAAKKKAKRAPRKKRARKPKTASEDSPVEEAAREEPAELEAPRDREEPRDRDASADPESPAKNGDQPEAPVFVDDEAREGERSEPRPSSRRGRRGRGRKTEDRNDNRGERNDNRGDRNDNREDRNDNRGDRNDNRGDRNDNRGDRNDNRGERRGRRPASQHDRHSASSARPRQIRQRLAVLLDLERILREAESKGGELAFTKLFKALVGRRELIRAIAYGSSEQIEAHAGILAGNGVELQIVPGPDALAVSIAVDAMSIAAKVDCLALVPGEEALAPLAKSLRANGVRVESASFNEPEGEALPPQKHHELGEECLFTP